MIHIFLQETKYIFLTKRNKKMNKYLEWKMHIIHLIIVEYSKAPKYTTDEKKGLVATKNKNLSISLALNLRIMHLLILHH